MCDKNRRDEELMATGGFIDPDRIIIEPFSGKEGLIKKLTLEELREQFENKLTKTLAVAPPYEYELLWIAYQSCAKANKILKDGEL